MAPLGLIEYDAASPEVRAVYDDIMATRRMDWVNNFWKALAHDPVTLRRIFRTGAHGDAGRGTGGHRAVGSGMEERSASLA